MSYSNGVISAPIAASDPYYVLGIGQVNGGFDVGWACESDNINKWSFNKPIYLTNITPLSTTDIINANCGITNTPYFNRLLYMAQNMVNNTPQPIIGLKPEYWSWKKPSTHYRLTDFNRYWHKAVRPIGDINSTNIEIHPKTNTYRISFSIAPDDDMNIRLNDLKLIDNNGGLVQQCSNMYFGVCLTNGSNNNNGSWFITQLTKISQINEYGAYVDVTDGLETVGSWTCFAFLSNRQLPLTREDNVIGLYAPLNFTKVSVIVKEKIPAVTLVIFQAAVFNRTIKVDFELVNKDDISYNTSAITVEVLNIYGTVLATNSLMSAIVDASSTKIFTTSFVNLSIANINSSDRVRVSLSISNKNYVEQFNIMK